MTRTFHHLLTAALAPMLALMVFPCVGAAQEVVQPLPGTTDADRLADTMRRLAANPRDVDALVRAGELSMGLGDLSGAAALFARAEKVDARNGRVKAGMAAILVRSERPGEALRYFAQAEGFGLAPRAFAADRGLAYDLIGQQDRAQRDYRVALRDGPDDETVRRYALSLGISGQQALALQQLAPLIQKSDRGAWRARAFILAMTGDVAGATYIATTMMPAGMSQGLQPFFQRLPTLAAADRAFAVHFGEVHASAERIADARMTPPLPALGPDASTPVAVAAVQPTAPVQVAAVTETRRDRRTRPPRGARRERIEGTRVPIPATAPVVTVPPPVQLASAVPTSPAPVPRTIAVGTPAPQASASPAVAPVVTFAQVAPSSAAVSPTASVPVAPAPQRTVVAATAATVAAPVTIARASPTPSATVPPATIAPTPASPLAAALQASITPAPLVAAARPEPVAPTTVAASTRAAIVAPPKALASREDSILARIIANLSIPASELDVAPARAPAPAARAAASISPDAQRVVTEAKAKAARDAVAQKALDETLAIDRKAAARKAIADKKALAEKKAAAEKKAIADKEAAEEKRIARANPERIWVQVSTGATEGDLPKAWRTVKAKAPAAFGSRGGWTTPWRATNRVLAGPFKTDAEARALVNALSKEGVSTFSFTSDAGQVITKLPPK